MTHVKDLGLGLSHSGNHGHGHGHCHGQSRLSGGLLVQFFIARVFGCFVL